MMHPTNEPAIHPQISQIDADCFSHLRKSVKSADEVFKTVQKL
jgi:hypothetical protein